MMVVLTVGVWEHQPEGVERQALAGWLAFVDVLLLHAPSYLSSVLHQARHIQGSVTSANYLLFIICFACLEWSRSTGHDI